MTDRHSNGEWSRSGSSSADEELQEMLRDAEDTVARLKAELNSRRSLLDDPGGTEAEQHAEIERLAEHLANAKVHWGEVRAFFEEALRELSESRSRRGGSA